MALASVTAQGGDGIPQTYAQPIGDWRTTALETLGRIRREGNKRYKYVKYIIGAETLTAGAAVSYEGYNANEVTGDHSAGEAIGAGIVQGTPVDDNFGWIQIGGIAAIEIDSTGAAGQGLMIDAGTTDNTLEVGAAVTDFVCAVMLDATANAQIIICNFPD